MISTEQRHLLPSQEKYGSILIKDGFTQIPHSVQEYLNTLDLCSTAIILIFTLLTYRWKAEQEAYPSVRTLAERCKVSPRRINQLTAQLAELGLLIKSERFAERSQLTNAYDLEPLFEKVAAWKDSQIAAKLDEQESQADTPFEPADVLEQMAWVISEEFGEPAPRQVRYNARRLGRRVEQNAHIEWQRFCDLMKKATKQTEKRKEEPTRSGRCFEKLVPYFFSALDYWLSREPQPVTSPTIKPSTTQLQPVQKQLPQSPPEHQSQRHKSNMLVERTATRKAAEAAGQAKRKAPETLKLRIEATALTFRDKHVKSSIQRAANLMADAALDELTMCELVGHAAIE